MGIRRCQNAAEFLALTSEFRDAEPVLTNLMGSVAETAARGGDENAALWLVVVAESGEVTGCAIRTPPWHLVVSPMTDDAAESVGRFVRDIDPDVPGIAGPEHVVPRVVDGLGAEVALRRREFIRVVSTLLNARDTAGEARRADEPELDLLREWTAQFGVEVGLPHLQGSAADRSFDGGRLWVWAVDDEPVAMAGHAPLVRTAGNTVGRIGPVFTPVKHRRRGYGAALTHRLARELQRDCTVVMLVADEANPDSNAVYEKLGFRQAARLVEVEIVTST